MVTPATGDARTMGIKGIGIPGQREDHQGQQQLWGRVCLSLYVMCAVHSTAGEVALPRPVEAQKTVGVGRGQRQDAELQDVTYTAVFAFPFFRQRLFLSSSLLE